jgi:hypothetical protein
MLKRIKLSGVLVLAIGVLMLTEGLPVAETLAVGQNSNSSTTMQNMNMSKTGTSRRRSARRHRRGRRGRGRRG